jgi:hypothetical protein
MPLVSYDDDESLDLFLERQRREQRRLEREERASASQEIEQLDEPEEEDYSQFGRGIRAGIDQTQGLGGGLKALAGSVLGKEDWVRDGLAYYNEKMAEADEIGGDFQRVEDIESFGDALDYGLFTLGTLVPDLIGGGGAGLLVKAGVKKAVKNQVQDAVEARVQQAVADGAVATSNKIALKKIRKEYEDQALGKIPQRAAIAGAGAYSVALNSAENFTEIEAETGKLDPVAALTVGVAQGALDSIGVPMRAFKKLYPDKSPEGIRTGIAEQINDNRSAVRRIITEATKTAGVEGGVEAMQEVMGRAAVAWANESLPESEQQEFFEIMAGENARSLYLNSFVAGGIGGGVIGGSLGALPPFDPAEYDNTLGKMVDAKRAAKNAAAETDNTPQEQTVDLGEMPMDQESTSVYMGDMPIALQEQVMADGFEDDIAPIEAVREAVTKLDGIEQQRAKNALNRLGLNQQKTIKVQPEKEIAEQVRYEGPIFATSTPMSIDEKATELRQQNDSGERKKQIEGDDDFIAESMSTARIAGTLRKSRLGDPEMDSKSGEGKVKLEPIFENQLGREVSLQSDSIMGPFLEELTSVHLDLLDRGMPRQHIEGIRGTYALEGDIDLFDDAVAAYFPQNEAIAVKPEILEEALQDEEVARQLRYYMSHEIWHVADDKNGYTLNLPDLEMTFEDTDGDGIPDLRVGDAVAELYEQWDQETQLGKGFGYPFNYLEQDLLDATPEDRPDILRAAQREVFAQLGAVYLANPRLLKENAPNAYRLIKALRDNASQTAEDIVREDNQTQDEAVSTQPSGISGEVRAPPIEGGPEVQDADGAGQDGGVSPEAGQADPQLGEQTEDQDGDEAGRLLRQQVVDFVSSQGEVQGVSPIQLKIRKGYNPTVELIDEMLSMGMLEETVASDGSLTYTAPQTQQPAPEAQQETDTSPEEPRVPVALRATSKKPTFKKAVNWDQTGEYIVTFEDGDRYTLYFDEDASEAGDDVNFESVDGKVTDLGDMLGTTKQEAINSLIDHRQKLIDAGQDSYNVPLNPEVGSEIVFKAFDFIDQKSPVTEKQLRAKFKSLEDNQFENLKKQLTDEQQDEESQILVEDGKYVSYGYVQERDQSEGPAFARKQVPISNAVERSKTKYAEYSSALEEEFFGNFWPRMMEEVGGTVTPDKVRTAAKRAVKDIDGWVKENPKYNNYYDEDMAAVRGALENHFGSVTDDDLLFFQVANGLTSPATQLRSNVGDAVRVLDLFKREGNLDSIVMGKSQKGNAIISSSPISISGTTGPTKARSLKVFDRLIKEKGGVRQAVDFLKEGVTAKELQAFNREMGYVSNVPNIPSIRSLVEQATGQDELIPRFFIFNKKIGAYTMNLSGDPRYTTIDVWESRFIRSYFDGLFQENTGLPMNVAEDQLFQDFSTLFKEEFDKTTGLSADPSTLQAMRWFYMINAAREAGYRGASTNETISEITVDQLQRLGGGGNESRRSGNEAAPSQDESQPQFARNPSYRSRDARFVARQEALKDLENSGIMLDDGVSEYDIDEATISPRFKRLLKALEREDYLGFDRMDDVMIMLFDDEDGLENYDVSPALKSAFGRYLNEVNGFTDDSPQFIRVPQPDNNDVSFNLNDDFSVDKSVESRLKKVMPKTVTRKLSDRLERLKDLENRFAEFLGLDRLPSAFSAYDNENLMHSKVQKQLEDFEKAHVVPIAELIKDSDLELDQVGLYLLAKHAPERNAKIAQQERELRDLQIEIVREEIDSFSGDNDAELARLQRKLEVLETAPLKYQEKGSGMTDEEAQATIELAENEGRSQELEQVAERVYAMLSEMRQNMVEQGLLDNKTKEDWQDTYQFYVPLKGFAAFPEGLEMKGGSGTQGFSIKGSESFKAKGRVTLPVNPLTVSFKDAEEKIVRAEKNRTAQKLLKMFEKFQSPDNWRVYNQKVRPPRDDNPAEMKSNQEMRSERRADDGLPRYIEVKRRGKSFFIEVRDQELNRQLQSGGVGMFNNQVDFMNKALTAMQKFQNFRRNMLINYNPSWGLVNPLRDVQTGLAFAISELDAKGGRLEGRFDGGTDLFHKITKAYVPSLRAFWRQARGTEGKTEEAREYDQFAREYVADGAPTGLSVTKSLEEQQQRFENLMGQTARARGINKLRPAFDWVEDLNQTTENAARLATYIEARKAGVERADAATLAKDLTVNFNRKGEYSSAIDSLYLFFNAAIQGNVNIIKALTRGKKEGGVSKAQTLAASMVMFGFARTLANISMAGEDDDGESNYIDYNEYVMKTSMVFTDGRQGYAMPMPYGYGLLDNIGRFGAEMVMGIKTPEQVAVDLATSVDHHFNPMSLHATGDDRDLIESAMLKGMFLLSPDIGDMAIEQIANVNFFGSNITIPSNPLLVERPASYASKRGTNEVITGFAEFINDVTGGSEYRSGVVDLSPERMMHFYEFLMGGVGRFLDDFSDTVMKLESEEPDLLPKDVPILRTFMPMASEYSDRVTFYQNRGEFLQYRREFKESNRADQIALQRRFGPKLYQFELTHKAIEKKLREFSKQKKALYDDKVIDSMVRWKRLQAIAEAEEKLFDEYNKRFDAVKP